MIFGVKEGVKLNKSHKISFLEFDLCFLELLAFLLLGYYLVDSKINNFIIMLLGTKSKEKYIFLVKLMLMINFHKNRSYNKYIHLDTICLCIYLLPSLELNVSKLLPLK